MPGSQPTIPLKKHNVVADHFPLDQLYWQSERAVRTDRVIAARQIFSTTALFS